MRKSEGHHFLNFTRKEKHGVIFLLSFVLLMAFLPRICNVIFPPQKIEQAKFRDELAELLISEEDNEKAGSNYPRSSTDTYNQRSALANTRKPADLFYFDPNLLSSEGWQKLGIKKKTIATINNYLSKGGKFRSPDDIRKVWGIPPALAEQLIPFVKFEKQFLNSPSNSPRQNVSAISKQPPVIDANDADSAGLVSLPGIGPGYAKRILKFRERLGGFYSVDQIGETFGLPDSTFQKVRRFIKVKGDVRKININTATNEELKQHPYIRWQMANMIAEYRQQHGRFKTVADLKNLMQVTDEWYEKVLPYLAVD